MFDFLDDIFSGIGGGGDGGFWGNIIGAGVSAAAGVFLEPDPPDGAGRFGLDDNPYRPREFGYDNPRGAGDVDFKSAVSPRDFEQEWAYRMNRFSYLIKGQPEVS